MKKYLYFFTMIFIVIALSIIIIAKSVNESNLSLMETNKQISDEIDQNEVIEEDEKITESENKVITETVQEVPKITETIDQTQTIEIPKEEKVNIETPQKGQKNQATTTTVANQTTKKETTKIETPKVEAPQEAATKKSEIQKCSGNNHGVGTGNSGRWFNSESECISYYKSIIKTWGDKWESFEIDDETYQKNCPYGYEDWSCPYCGKWTINFYYN